MAPSNASDVSGYGRLQIIFHWLSAALVLASLAGGALILKHLPNTADKIGVLRAHVVIGLAAGLAGLAGVLVRRLRAQPPRLETGDRRLDALAVVVHTALPVVTLGMATSGVALAIEAGLPGILFGGSSSPLPQDFWVYAPRLAHAAFAKVLIGLVALHVAGSLFHHFICKDGVLARMWPRRS